MRSPGINGEGELMGQPPNPGSPGKMAVKTVCVCVCWAHLKIYDQMKIYNQMTGKFTIQFLTSANLNKYTFSQFSYDLCRNV